MESRATKREAATLIKSHSNFSHELSVLLIFIQFALGHPAIAQEVGTLSVTNPAPLTAEQVVRKLGERNLQRAQSLKGFHGTRVYRAEYRGIGGTRSAEMLVNVEYRLPPTKEFTIQSATGSKLIIDRVFKKLLEAEKEALDVDMQRRSALTEDNYRFTLVGYETEGQAIMYVLEVEPRTKHKFLYRGRIWIDASDFAVVRLKAEPAKNPSFWTRKAEVVQEYKKVGAFWLPVHNRSLSAIRLGGHAELTIDYQGYEIVEANQLSSEAVAKTGHSVDLARRQR